MPLLYREKVNNQSQRSRYFFQTLESLSRRETLLRRINEPFRTVNDAGDDEIRGGELESGQKNAN